MRQLSLLEKLSVQLRAFPVPCREFSRATRDPVERFVEKVRPSPDGCLEWGGSRSPQDYGWFSWEGRPMLAHRWAMLAGRGRISEGLVVDHLCRNRACVRLDHLECVPMAENTRRGLLHEIISAKAKRRTMCRRGHPLFGPNLKITSGGHRSCKACQRMKAAEWRAINRERVNHLQRLRRASGRV